MLKCDLVRKVSGEFASALNIAPGREKKVMHLCNIEYAAGVESGVMPAVLFIGRLVEEFGAQRELLGHFALRDDAGEDKVLVVFSPVEPVTAAAVNRPLAEALLKPEREQYLRAAVAQSFGRIS